MHMHQSLVVVLPTLLSCLFSAVDSAPTSYNTNDSLPEIQLGKRGVNPWIAAFSDVGCHNVVSKHMPLDNPTHCVNWDSNQPGKYFAINWGQLLVMPGYKEFNQIQLFTQPGCQSQGGEPLFPGDDDEPAGNYVQQSPPGVYNGKAPMGECFDGVFRHWPVASDGSRFKSFHASVGPQHKEGA